MPANEAVILRAFGNLEGTVASMATQWRDQEAAAAKSRKELYEKFEGVALQISKVQSDVSSIRKDMADIVGQIDEKIMPTVESYKIGTARKDGAHYVGKVIWGAVVGSAALIGVALHQILSYFRHPGP